MMISRDRTNNCAGFVLIEVLMVLVIIGSLSLIAIPNYSEYREKALASQCQANRYHIEMEELAYFAENNKPRLTIDNRYECPCGGTYVWLVMDPEDSRYPQIGCSIHFTGSTTETSTPTVEDISPSQLIDDLMTYVYNLNLRKILTNSLISKLKKAANALERDKNNKPIKILDNFIKQVKKQQKKKKISQEEADILISKAEKINTVL